MKDPSCDKIASSLDMTANMGGDAGGGLETGHIDDVDAGHGHCKSLTDGDLIS